jgi:hypothetical protein
MSEHESAERELKHELANAVQQKKALQKLLLTASDHIEELVAKECADEDKAERSRRPPSFRRAAACESIRQTRRERDA